MSEDVKFMFYKEKAQRCLKRGGVVTLSYIKFCLAAARGA